LTSCSLLVFRGRVLARRPTDFLLLRQKKVSKEKATLLSATLRFATGNLRCSTPVGVRRTRFAQTAAALIPRAAPTAGAYRRAFERAIAALGLAIPTSNTTANASPRQIRASAHLPFGPSEAMARVVSKPLWLRRGAECFADQGRSCLSAASSADPAKREHRRLPRSEAQGSQTVGSPFFCLRFFGEAKKSRSAAGPRPGLRPPQGEQRMQGKQRTQEEQQR
jgi:hypothetical protein